MLTLLHLATEVEANKAVEILGSNATRKCLSHAETLIEVPFLQLQGGIRSADLVRVVCVNPSQLIPPTDRGTRYFDRRCTKRTSQPSLGMEKTYNGSSIPTFDSERG